MEPTLPTTSEFYLDGEPHISPARLIAEFCAAEGVTGEELGVRPTVVVTFGTRLTQFLADNAGARRTDRRLPISLGDCIPPTFFASCGCPLVRRRRWRPARN